MAQYFDAAGINGFNEGKQLSYHAYGSGGSINTTIAMQPGSRAEMQTKHDAWGDSGHQHVIRGTGVSYSRSFQTGWYDQPKYTWFYLSAGSYSENGGYSSTVYSNNPNTPDWINFQIYNNYGYKDNLWLTVWPRGNQCRRGEKLTIYDNPTNSLNRLTGTKLPDYHNYTDPYGPFIGTIPNANR